jgi:hypothetical protein
MPRILKLLPILLYVISTLAKRRHDTSGMIVTVCSVQFVPISDAL